MPLPTNMSQVNYSKEIKWYLNDNNLSVWAPNITYSNINIATGALEKTLVSVNNLLSYDGMKMVISKAATNFISSSPLSTLIITLIGLKIAEKT